jgi:tyrosine-protein kinase Etk/Wzc
MEQRELTLKELWTILWNGKILIIRNSVITFVTIAALSLMMSNWYKATVTIMPPTGDSGGMGAMSMLSSFGLGGFFGGDDSQTRVMSILKSKTVQQELARRFNLQEKYQTENMEETLKVMEENYAVDLQEEMQISVTFWDTDQEMVAAMTNQIVVILDSMNIALSTSKAHENRVFIESRVNEVLDSLKVLENELSTFMQSEGILSLTDQVAMGVKTAAEIKAQLMEKEIELAIARNVMDMNNPHIRQLTNEINGFKAKLKEFYTESKDDNLIPNFSRIPELEIRFTKLQRKSEYFVKLLEFLGPQYESAKIEEAKTIPTIQVLDRAVRPEKKDKPRRSRIVLGFTVIVGALSAYYVYLKNRQSVLAA